MKNELILKNLEQNRLVFKSLLEGKEADEYNFRPDPASWSILEIVCHLYDEEREDFRARIQHLFKYPGTKPPAIDPQGWVKSRKYAVQDYPQKLKDFLSERRQSMRWLNGLENPKWKNSYEHPTAGIMSAQSLLVNWLAHDYHHIRQINRRQYEYLNAKSGVSLKYAGDW